MAIVESDKGRDLDFRVLSSIDEIESETLQKFYKYWLEIKGDRKAPEASGFDLLEVPDSITYCGILEVVEGGKDFRVKFLGQAYTLMVSRDSTGKLLSELESDVFNQRSIEIFRLSTTTGKPVINGFRTPSVKLLETKFIQSLTLPLLENGEIKELAVAVTTAENG